VPEHITELEAKSTASDIWDDQQKANDLFAKLRGLKKQWDPVIALKGDVDSLVEMTQMASIDDVPSLQSDYEKAIKEWAVLEPMLYLSGEFDHNNCYITISGGAGGTEAQDWAGFLMRMYLRYCERMGWTTTLVDKTDGQEAGIKTATIYVEGDPAYGYLKCEKGTHRLVRLSPFTGRSASGNSRDR
jgi:peptide chain release factor 2